MCGHGTIAICIVLVEMGMLEAQQPETETVLDTLAGLVRAKVAVMAVLHGKGELGFNEELVHESILGTLFYGRLIEETKVGPYTAVVPTITGIQQFALDVPCWVPLGQEGQTVGRWIRIRSMG